MGNGLEVDGMFAVCIAGGASLILKNSEVKRRVPISNFYLGILVIAVIENGMQLSGSIQYYQYVITSVVVLYSVIPTLPAFLPKIRRRSRKIKNQSKQSVIPEVQKNNAQAAGDFIKNKNITQKQ